MYKTRTACQTALNQIKKAFARLYVCKGPTTLTEDVVRAMLGFDHEDPFFKKDIPGINFPQGLQPKDKADLLQIAFARNVLKKLSTSILDSKIIEEINRETIVSFMELNEMLINVGFNISKYLDEWTLEMGRRRAAPACMSGIAANAAQPFAQQPAAQQSPPAASAACISSPTANQPCAQPCEQPVAQPCEQSYPSPYIGTDAFHDPLVYTMCSHPYAASRVPCIATYCTQSLYQYAWKQSALAKKPFINGWTGKPYDPSIDPRTGKPKTPNQRYLWHKIDKDGVPILSDADRLTMEGSHTWFCGNSASEEAEAVTIIDHATNEPFQILVFRNYPDGFRTEKMVDRETDEEKILFLQFQWDEIKAKREMNKYQRISSAPSTPREKPPSTLRVAPRFEAELQPAASACMSSPTANCAQTPRKGRFGFVAKNPFKVNHVQFNH